MWYFPPSRAAHLGIMRNAHGEPFLNKYFPLKGNLEDPFFIRHGVYPGYVREIISLAMYLEVLEGRGKMVLLCWTAQGCQRGGVAKGTGCPICQEGPFA